MSNLWFNIKFGKRHFQFSRDWKISFHINSYWDREPEAYLRESWLVIYCAFGKHF